MPVPAHFRKSLDLFANVRPSYTRDGVAALGRKMDLVFVRENLEEFYADRNMAVGTGEFMPTEDVALAVGKITKAASRRIAHAAFDLARHVLTLARRWHRPAHELTARAALWLTALRIDDRASIRYEHRAIHELRASGAEVSVQARVWLVAGEALLSERSDEGEVRAPRIVRRR